MNEEIKEIIDRMKELVKHKYDKEIHTHNLFDDIEGLLDYITYLQQEKEKMKIYDIVDFELFIDNLNQVIEEAITHGGDSGGAYFCNFDKLLSAIQCILMELQIEKKVKIVVYDEGYIKLEVKK